MAESYNQPNPDELLARISKEEEQKKRGRLKIFLGYAAGVGKTYTMLDAARERKNELDTVIGYVETHGRAETDALLKGMEIIPPRAIEYGGVKLPEMDLDAVLARHPQLALVDELAHTNAQGSRHPKRYQDVEELLEAGIDVYTTLNIQHVESLRNVVAQVTGVWIRETLPDSVIDKASEIELVDLPPEELLKRLKAGKVYVPERIESAIANFFRKGNLTALRELAMRTAAEHVDDQMRAYMEDKDIKEPWQTAERILVCISPSSLGSRLVRTARRLASQLNAEWSAIYIETPNDVQMSPEAQERLRNSLQLAERMGAGVITVKGHSVAAAIMDFARINHITKIVVGRPQKGLVSRVLPGRTVVDQLISQSEHMDVYVVTGKAEQVKPEEVLEKASSFEWQHYLPGLGLLVLATLLGYVANSLFSLSNVIISFLLCVVVTAIFWGMGPSIMVSILSVLAYDFLFISPSPSFAVPGSENFFSFFMLLLAGAVISFLTSRFRRQIEASRNRERQTSALYALSRDLALSADLESYLNAIIARTRQTFGHDSVIFLPDMENRGALKHYSSNQNLTLDEKELAAATWSFQRQKIVGYGTDTLPYTKARYFPLITSRGAVGILGLWMADTTEKLTVPQERLLEAYADLVAVAIDNIKLAEEAHHAEILRATDKLQTAFLNSISQDLRTPLVYAAGVLDRLLKEDNELDSAARRNLVRAARDEVDTLVHSITNLIDMSRIEAGAIQINRESADLRKLATAALEQLTSVASGHQVKIDIPAGLPAVSVDFNLIVQTLVNVLDNAFKYSSPGSPVEFSARQRNKEIEIHVADRGTGIPPQDLSHVFDKFYRVQRPDNVLGTGLGLTICKGLVEAHGGRIWAENRADGGTIIKLALPLAEAKK